MPETINATVTDLTAGDRLINIGGVGFAQFRDRSAPPVLVCDVRPPHDDAAPGQEIAEIITSSGVHYAHADAPVTVLRDDAIRPDTILLISRRQSLHAALLAFGVPVIRRTPVEAGKKTPSVTADEWMRAPLIVIDGYLAQQTLRAMWQRGDLIDRDQIIMVGNDPDDTRVYDRRAAANARALAILPYDGAGVADMFRAATGTSEDANPYLGILTPVTPSRRT
jgi:hypothetical protein